MPTIAFLSVLPPALFELLQRATPAGFTLLAVSAETEAERLAVAHEADYLMVWGGGVSGRLIEVASRARLIQKVGRGFDDIDLAAAGRRGIPVANAGETNGVAVAEHTILLMLAVYRQMGRLDAAVRQGRWFKFELRLGSFELYRKRVGIIGLGAIGKKVARRLQGFECEVAYYDIVRPELQTERALGASFLPRAELLASSDIVTLHVPLQADTRGLIGREELRLMRRSAVLINTARGAVVDEPALYQALQNRWLAGAGLDVYAHEPPDPANPLLELENVVLSPHVAGGTLEAAERTIRAAMDNVLRVEQGELPLNAVGSVED